MIEKIAEYPVTEWHGARIRITIEVPQISNSLSTQIIIDSRELNELKALKPPTGLEQTLENTPEYGRFRLMQWQNDNQKVKNLLKAISDRISWQVGQAIGDALNK